MRIGVLVVMLVAGVAMGAEPEAARPVVGAIRWDAWSGGRVTGEVEKSLGPKAYHERLPWFAKVKADGAVEIDGGRQEVMDAEIGYAARAGLDYWAFVGYGKDDAMSRSLGLYLASAKREGVKFCLILHRNMTVGEAEWPGERDRAVGLLKERTYQKVLDGRPLVLALEVPVERFAEFKKAAEDAGVHPYCVRLGWDPGKEYAEASKAGYDAVGAYAYGSDVAMFGELAKAVEQNYWGRAAEAGVPYVPLVTTGWDKRPRQEHPVSWEAGQAYLQQKVFPTVARAEELAGHLKRAVEFVEGHPKVCASRAILMYAWNEHDEGGWIEPTWKADGSANMERVDAIAGVLKGR